jgi:antitoxin YefM
MAAITASEARKRLFPLIEQINEDRIEVEVVHRSGNVVLVSKDQWDAMVETAYLSRGANGRMLRRRIADMEAGKGVQRDLLEDDE